MRVIQSARNSPFFLRRSRYAYRMARSAVSLAALYSLLRPPRAPFAASMIFFFRAWWATPLFTRGIEPSGQEEAVDAGEIGRAHEGSFLEPVLPLARLLGQDVRVVRMEPLELPRTGPDEALHRGALGFLLRHSALAVGRLFRREYHRHVPALELRLGLDFAYVHERRRDPVQHRLAQFQVGDLPAAVHHGHFHLVAVAEELPRVAGLEVEIVVVDPRPVLHFLELDDVLLLLGRPGRLGFLELELPVVHDLDHGRARHRRYFHEIQPTVLGRRHCFVHRHDP